MGADKLLANFRFEGFSTGAVGESVLIVIVLQHSNILRVFEVCCNGLQIWSRVCADTAVVCEGLCLFITTHSYFSLTY